MPSDDLLCEDQALYVDGLGYLDQYGSYVDTLWEKGVVYFLRDYLLNTVETELEKGTRARDLRPLIERLNALNSDLAVWESHGRPRGGPHRAAGTQAERV